MSPMQVRPKPPGRFAAGVSAGTTALPARVARRPSKAGAAPRAALLPVASRTALGAAAGYLLPPVRRLASRDQARAVRTLNPMLLVCAARTRQASVRAVQRFGDGTKSRFSQRGADGVADTVIGVDHAGFFVDDIGVSLVPGEHPFVLALPKRAVSDHPLDIRSGKQLVNVTGVGGVVDGERVGANVRKIRLGVREQRGKRRVSRFPVRTNEPMGKAILETFQTPMPTRPANNATGSAGVDLP